MYSVSNCYSVVFMAHITQKGSRLQQLLKARLFLLLVLKSYSDFHNRSPFTCQIRFVI